MQATPQLKQIIGLNIAATRARLKLSRREFGQLIGDVDQSLIYKWERGLHRPTDANLAAVALAAKVDMAWLCTDHSAGAPA